MFDPVNNCTLNLIQRPLIAMECSFFSKKYMNLSYDHESVELFERLKEKCRSVSGQFTLLWHNSKLADFNDRIFYQKVLSL